MCPSLRCRLQVRLGLDQSDQTSIYQPQLQCWLLSPRIEVDFDEKDFQDPSMTLGSLGLLKSELQRGS